MSLLLLDLDHFKRFNDHYGHQVGDDCLRTVATTIEQGARRPDDVIAHYGGEELAVILANTGPAGAVQIAEQIRSAIEALQIPHSGNPEGGGVVTASIGAASAICRTGGTMAMPQALLTAADTALYKAKYTDRNKVKTGIILAHNTKSL